MCISPPRIQTIVQPDPPPPPAPPAPSASGSTLREDETSKANVRGRKSLRIKRTNRVRKGKMANTTGKSGVQV